MFGIGGDDKDKLKENMEDIKEMVNNSTPASNSPDQKGGVDELEEEFSKDFEEQPSPEDPSQSSNTTQSFSQDQKTQKPGNLSQPDSESFEERFQSQEPSQEEHDFKQNNHVNQQENSQEKQVQRFESQDSNEAVENTDTTSQSQQEEPSNSPPPRASRLDESIPEPAKTKDINVPDIDKGPLFIRRQKFESAKNMIEEMRYISREIEDVVNQLERGIEEDQTTEQEAKELLNSLEKDRSGVKNIISQQDKQQE